MIEGYQIKYEPLAKAALREAVGYIRENSSPGRAGSWLRSMLESVDKLETLPKAFGVWAIREGVPLFSKLVPPFRVFYVVNDATSTVHIIDVVHTARETRLAEYRDPPD